MLLHAGHSNRWEDAQQALRSSVGACACMRVKWRMRCHITNQTFNKPDQVQKIRLLIRSFNLKPKLLIRSFQISSASRLRRRFRNRCAAVLSVQVVDISGVIGEEQVISTMLPTHASAHKLAPIVSILFFPAVRLRKLALRASTGDLGPSGILRCHLKKNTSNLPNFPFLK